MPRRPSDDPARTLRSASGISKPHNYKKTERTHEENQERAYIAASRRSDRSIEARVQSARQASEIHKIRTGKSLRVTEEIVRNEEMYEEEEDDLPRSFRAMKQHFQQHHMQHGNEVLNQRVEAFLSNKMAMSQFMNQNQQHWAHENEVNRAFAEAFPNVSAGQRMSSISSMPPSSPHPNHGSISGSFGTAPVQHQRFDAPPNRYEPVSRPSFGQVNYQQPAGYHSRGQSFSGPAQGERRPDMPSPPALTPGSQATTPQSQQTPYFGSFAAPNQPSLDLGHPDSSFTSELPNEAKMMMGHEGGMPWNTTFDTSSFNTSDWQDQQYLPVQKLGDGQDNLMEYPDLTPQPVESVEEPQWQKYISEEAYAADDSLFNVNGEFTFDQKQ